MKLLLSLLCVPFAMVKMQTVDLLTAISETHNLIQTQHLDVLDFNFVMKITEWSLMKTMYGISSDDSTVDSLMFNTFILHGELCNRHNVLAKKGNFTYQLGTNRYCVVAFAESRQLKHKLITFPQKHNHEYKISNKKPEPSVDWRTKCSLLSVYDQGLTHYSWAYAVVGAVEATKYIKTSMIQPLSAQELINCTIEEGTSGSLVSALDYAMQSGILTDSDFKAVKQNVCARNKSQSVTKIKGYLKVQANETHLLSAVSEGPVVAVICCGSIFTFHFYKSGIYSESQIYKCNHAVIIMGYGTTPDGKDYWIIKNSFGPTWGENGYMRLARGKNVCGIANHVYLPLIK